MMCVAALICKESWTDSGTKSRVLTLGFCYLHYLLPGGAYGLIYVGSKYGGPHCRIGDKTLYVIGDQKCFQICCGKQEVKMQNKSGITQRGNSTICRSTSLVGGLLEKALGTYLNAQVCMWIMPPAAFLKCSWNGKKMHWSNSFSWLSLCWRFKSLFFCLHSC
jgi:hypothetical protein